MGEGVEFVQSVGVWEKGRACGRLWLCVGSVRGVLVWGGVPPTHLLLHTAPLPVIAAAASSRSSRCLWPVQAEPPLYSPLPGSMWLQPLLETAHGGKKRSQAGPPPLLRAPCGSCAPPRTQPEPCTVYGGPVQWRQQPCAAPCHVHLPELLWEAAGGAEPAWLHCAGLPSTSSRVLRAAQWQGTMKALGFIMQGFPGAAWVLGAVCKPCEALCGGTELTQVPCFQCPAGYRP